MLVSRCNWDWWRWVCLSQRACKTWHCPCSWKAGIAPQKSLWGLVFLVMISCDVWSFQLFASVEVVERCWKNLFPSFCWGSVNLSWPAKSILEPFYISEILYRAYESPQVEIVAFWIMVSLSSNLPKVMATLGSSSPNIQSHCFGSQDLST